MEIRQYIVECVTKKAKLFGTEIGAINDDFSLTGSGLFDSMDFISLIVEVEAKFNVEIDFSESEPDYFATLGGFIQCARKKE
jgi:acyl carrier protein